ncbi:MAG: maturase [Candidatus Accumulibacter sp.]|nr:maturase [Accumulibacter sp.]
MTRRTRGATFAGRVAERRETLFAWKAYCGITEVLGPLRDLDKWVRRRLRCHLWKQWGRAGYRKLCQRGVSVREAWHSSPSTHGPWRVSRMPALSIALPLRFFEQLRLPSLVPRWEFNSSNRRIRDPFFRWCKPSPIPYSPSTHPFSTRLLL